MLWRRILPLVLFIGAPSVMCFSRDLHWRRIDVKAALDRDGRLRVTERQTMVFTGDWNGGERAFNVRFRQTLDFHGIIRADADGVERPLVRGNLAEVDRWDWANSRTVRWRSRLPSDPVFDKTQITYILEYTLSGVLALRDGFYVLDHDFCFPNRAGPVESFSLQIDLDPVWIPARPLALFSTAGPLRPGHGFVVTAPLRHEGKEPPSAVWIGAPAEWRAALFAVVGAAFGALLLLLYRRERALGRLAPVFPASSIDEAWLREHLFVFKPEVVGAAWDERTGAAEVAAVIARLVSEGKLQSEVRHNGTRFSRREALHLRMLVPRDRFEGYERRLVDALFINGDVTDSERVRDHYRNTGFDPVSKIREGLSREKERAGMQGAPAARPRKLPSLVLMLAGAVTIILAGIGQGDELGVVAGALAIGAPCYIAALIGGLAWRNRVMGLRAHALWFLAPLTLLLAAFAVLTGTGFLGAGLSTLMGLGLLALAAANSALNAAKSRQGGDKIRFRKSLAAAREFFRLELRNPRPRLEDAWFPYLIAFGLGRQADRWFQSYGRAQTDPSPGPSVLTGDSHPAPSTWTGGGGAFGGAGASGTWAAAAGTLAAGVAEPSSSGGSSGGGGGGSSGGGGGGGW